MLFQKFAHFWVLCALLFHCLPCSAQTATTQIPGWAANSISLSGSSIRFSSPVIAEIDGNAANGLEIAVTGADARLYVYLANGMELWSVNLPNYNCSEQSDSNRVIHSSPAVADIDGDGRIEVVQGYGGIGGKSCDGGVAAYHGDDGSVDWVTSIKTLSKKNNYWAFLHSVVSTPALADTNGNGKMEIGFGAFDRKVYKLNSRGKVIWDYIAADTVWSSAAFSDIDGDGSMEMLIGTDISANSEISPPTQNGGYLYAFKDNNSRRVSAQSDIMRMLKFRRRAHSLEAQLRRNCKNIKNKAKRKKCKKKQAAGSGTEKLTTTHYQFRDPRIIAWSQYFNQTIFSQPVVADVLPSAGEEIIVMSGCFFPQGTSQKNGQWIKILRASDGQVLKTLNTRACSETSVAVGDIDEDGQLEIVAATPGDSSIGGDGSSYLSAWNPDDAEPFWEIVPRYKGSNNAWSPRYASVAIADLDHNGSLEVIHANGRAVGIYEGKTGTPLTCYNNCDESNVSLVATGASLYSTPAIGDINNDLSFELIIGASSGASGALFGWSNFDEFLGSQQGSLPAGSRPWPMFRGNPRRDGRFVD